MPSDFGRRKPRDKDKVYAWSAAWMMLRGKTDEQIVSSLKKRFSWLSSEAIDVVMSRARTWIQNAEPINKSLKALEAKEEQP